MLEAIAYRVQDRKIERTGATDHRANLRLKIKIKLENTKEYNI